MVGRDPLYPDPGRTSWTPRGTRSVGLGVLVLGLTTYGFFVVASRRLTPEDFAGMSIVYTLLYTVGAGLFQPVEAQIGRTVAAAEATGAGARTAVVRLASLCTGLVLLAGVLLMSVRGAVAETIFGGDERLVVVSVAGLVCFAATYIVRGVLAGLGRFAAYSLQLASEGGLRLVAALVLYGAGVDSAAGFALFVAVTPLITTLLICARPWRLLRRGQQLSWGSAFSSLGWLSACGVASQTLANAGPLVIALLAKPEEFAEAGRFMAALILIRVPLFLFAAVQAALVPTVAGSLAQGRWQQVRREYRSLALLMVAFAGANALGTTALGGRLLALMFGPAYVLPPFDLLLLSVFAAAHLLAQLAYQMLVAAGALRQALVGWCLGLLVLMVATAVVQDLQRRTEIGLVLGGGTAALVLVLFTSRQLVSPRGVARAT